MGAAVLALAHMITAICWIARSFYFMHIAGPAFQEDAGYPPGGKWRARRGKCTGGGFVPEREVPGCAREAAAQ